MDLSSAIKEAYEYAQPDVTYYDTLTINHADFLEPIMVVRSHAQLETNQGTYQPVAFDLTLPETTGCVRGEMTITVNYLPKDARLKIREAAASRSAIGITYRQYINSNADPDAELPVALQVSSITETPVGIQVQALFPDLVGAYFPRRLMNVLELPGAIT